MKLAVNLKHRFYQHASKWGAWDRGGLLLCTQLFGGVHGNWPLMTSFVYDMPHYSCFQNRRQGTLTTLGEWHNQGLSSERTWVRRRRILLYLGHHAHNLRWVTIASFTPSRRSSSLRCPLPWLSLKFRNIRASRHPQCIVYSKNGGILGQWHRELQQWDVLGNWHITTSTYVSLLLYPLPAESWSTL